VPRKRYELDWEHLRAGKFDESDEQKNHRISGRALPKVSLGFPTKIIGTQQRCVAGRDAAHKIARYAYGVPHETTLVRTFHFHHNFVSRAKTPVSKPLARNDRLVLYPSRREVVLIRKLDGARHHKRARCWSIPKTSPLANHPVIGLMATDLRRISRESRSKKTRAAVGVHAAVEYQNYIERAGSHQKQRQEIEHDRKGAIIVGTLGRTTDERNGFWHAVDKFERRCDARLQNRIIVEFPYHFSAAARRRTFERFGEVFDEHGLPWCAVAHRPDECGDMRNFHGHIVFSDRPVTWIEIEFDKVTKKIRIVRPHFAETKNRECQGDEWITHLREEFAKSVNIVALEEALSLGEMPPLYFYPGTDLELGILSWPSQHMGPRAHIKSPRSSELSEDEEILPKRRRPMSLEKQFEAYLDRFLDDLDCFVETLRSAPTIPNDEGFEVQNRKMIDARNVAKNEALKRIDQVRRLVTAAENLLPVKAEAGENDGANTNPTADLSAIDQKFVETFRIKSTESLRHVSQFILADADLTSKIHAFEMLQIAREIVKRPEYDELMGRSRNSVAAPTVMLSPPSNRTTEPQPHGPVALRPAAPTLPTPRQPTPRQQIPVKRSQLSLLLKQYTIFVTDKSRAELLRRVRQFNLEELFVALEFTTFSLQQAEKRGEASTETSHQLGRGIRLLHEVLYEKNINPNDLDRRFKIIFDLEPTVAKPPPPSSAAISTSTSMSTQPPAPQKRRDRGWER
jgi:hypothetical protein